MKLIIKISGLVMLIPLLIGCNKSKTTEVSGTVYDYCSKQPVVNMEVKMNGQGVLGYKSLASTFSDANGNYYLKYEGKSKVESVSAESFYPNSDIDSTDYEEIEEEQTNKKNLFVYQEGKILVKIKNVNPVNENDLLHFWSYFGLPLGNDFTGVNINTSFYYRAIANTGNILTYKISKNSHDSIINSPKIYVPLDSIPTYEINY